MRIHTGRGKAHISVNARGTGDGLVIIQGQHRVLLSRAEWLEVRDNADSILLERP